MLRSPPRGARQLWFADYVLPMGVGAERHDVVSYETHSGRWIAFRQPVFRRYAEIEAARGKGAVVTAESRTHEYNPGEVWEENEFWIDLSWRIDPDGSMGIRQWFESEANPGSPIGIDEYYEICSVTRCLAWPKLPLLLAKRRWSTCGTGAHSQSKATRPHPMSAQSIHP